MLTIQEISDRFEIQQLVVDYATALDRRSIDDWDRIFTADAYIDYRATGGIDGRYPVIKAWIREVMSQFPGSQHMLGNISVEITGHTATGRIICFNPMLLNSDGGRHRVMFI